ncbi:MAG: DUF3309 family protein [Polyangiales bacterium]
MLTILLIVCLVFALGGGAWGHTRYGYTGWSPAGLLLLVLVVLWLTGNLHVSTGRVFGEGGAPDVLRADAVALR